MNGSVSEVFDAAPALSEQDRGRLANKLIESLDVEVDPDAEAKWATEIERRLSRIEAGQAKLVSMDEAVMRLQRRAGSMTREVLIDEDAIAETEAETRYYRERGGSPVALRFAAEVEEIYRGLASGRSIRRRQPSPGSVPPTAQARVPCELPVREKDYVVALEALRREPGYWQSRLLHR